MSGRCRDGQRSFLLNFIVHNAVRRCEESVSVEQADEPKNVLHQLQLSIGALMLEHRFAFINRHKYPFTVGSDQHRTTEVKTAVGTVLGTMLSLPLSLPGGFSEVAYPRFALHGQRNPATFFSASQLARRFVEGGAVEFVDDRAVDEGGDLNVLEANHVERISFPELSLAELGKVLRRSIVGNQEVLKESVADDQHRDEEELKGLELPLEVNSPIPLAAVLAYVRLDPILNTSFIEFEASEHTKDNRFFCQSTDMSHFASTFRDSAILRLLEVAGYARVPPGFYATANLTQFKLPQLTK